MTDHTVTVEYEGGPFVRMVCNAPTDAHCHARYTCDCEVYGDVGTHKGAPYHKTYDFEADQSGGIEDAHFGTFDPDYCALADWLADLGDDALEGTVSFDVEPEWTGEGYMFKIVGAEVVP